MLSGRRSSTIVAVRQFKDRDSASSSAKRAGNEADQQSTELLDKANAYVDDLKVPQSPIPSLWRTTTLQLLSNVSHALNGVCPAGVAAV